MAFQALLGGSETDCGPSNPLQQLLRRTRTQAQVDPQHSRYQADSSRQQQQQPYLLHDLRNELDSITHHDHPWQNQFVSSSSLGPAVSSDEMARMEHSFSHRQPHQWSRLYTEGEGSSTSHPLEERPAQQYFSAPTHIPIFARQNFLGQPSLFSPSPPMVTAQSSLKAQIVELSEENWEAEFAKIGNQLDGAQQPSQESKPEQEQSTETNRESSPTILDQETTDEDREADAEFLRSLEATWRGLAANLNAGSLSGSNWTEMTDDDFIGPNLSSHPTTQITPENVADFLHNPEPYPFQSNNPFLDHPDPFQEGHRLIQSGATLSEAALAFEAACQLDENRAEVWRMLGETQAADEKEQLAIKAFQRAVGCQDLKDQSAWLSLAICWVNEGQEIRALAILERWLINAYPGIASKPASTSTQDQNNPWARHGMVVEKFIQAARAGPESREGEGKETVRSQVVDVDVQVALGVLFYSNAEYERARDCFESALGVNPGDFSLWNRLGATLANGGRSEDAIGAYQRALEIRPTFTRAIYNLGVSCLNIHCYKQAVEHLLAALSLHSKAASIGDRPLLPAGTDGSENLWFTLRRAFICLDRSDLADLALPNTNLDIFRQHGFDF